MKKEIQSFKDSIAGVTKALAEEKILVTQIGNKPYVSYKDGKVSEINIPSMPDNPSEELVDAMRMFIDNQAASVLFSHKDNDVSKEAKGIFEVIEECRTAKLFSGKYKGSARIRQAGLKVLKKKLEKEGTAIATIFSMIRSKMGESVFDKSALYEENSDIYSIVQYALESLDFNVQTQEDAVNLAEKIAKIIRNMKSETSENDESEREGKGKGQGKEGESQGEAGGEQKSAPENDKEERKLNADDIQHSFEDEEIKENGIIDLIEKEIEKDSGYRVFTRDYDVVSHIKDEDVRTFPVDDLVKEVRTRSSFVATSLRMALSSVKIKKSQSSARKGILNPLKVAGILMGRDDIFYSREIQEEENTAVTLLTDFSGSMRGSKIECATVTAAVFAESMRKIGIDSEVIGFTAHFPGSFKGRHLLKDMEEMERKFARFTSLSHHIVKPFGARASLRELQKILSIKNSPQKLQDNFDGESLDFAAKRIMARPAARKIIFVISDGAPCAELSNHSKLDRHLESVIKKWEKAGIEIIGIGIESSEVRRFYKKNVVIKESKDLDASLMKKIKEILKDKPKKNVF